jgi:hypothetical protein
MSPSGTVHLSRHGEPPNARQVRGENAEARVLRKMTEISTCES